MKHKHYEMIVAKAANMDLVVFIKGREGWRKMSDQSEIRIKSTMDYFLCLPQHKEACLHWLNGGELQINRKTYNERGDELPSEGFLNWDRPSREWRPEVSFMNCNCSFKVKPKKEKRWIATFPWAGSAFYVTPEHFSTKEMLNDYVDMHYGKRDLMLVHEIEVEV